MAKGGTFRSTADARRAKAQGTDTENKAVAGAKVVLEHLFPGIERRKARGRRDAGDIAGIYGWTVEVKNSATRFTSRIHEAETSALNAATPDHWFLVAKLPYVPVLRWLAVTRYGVMLGWVREIEELRRRNRRYEQVFGSLPEDRTHQDAT